MNTEVNRIGNITIGLMIVLFLISYNAKASQKVLEDNKSLPFPAKVLIKDYGTYRLLERSEQQFNADATAGYASIIHTEHLETTEVIKLNKGVVFGFNVAIEDQNVDQEWVPIVIEIKHPLTVNYLGQQSTGFKKQNGARLKDDGFYHNGAFYIISEDFEMVPGEWIIRIVYQEEATKKTVKAEKIFTLVR